MGDLRFVVLEMSGGCEKENIDYILGVVNEHSRASTMVDDKSASNQHKKLVDITWRVQQRRCERLLSDAEHNNNVAMQVYATAGLATCMIQSMCVENMVTRFAETCAKGWSGHWSAIY